MKNEWTLENTFKALINTFALGTKRTLICKFQFWNCWISNHLSMFRVSISFTCSKMNMVSSVRERYLIRLRESFPRSNSYSLSKFLSISFILETFKSTNPLFKLNFRKLPFIFTNLLKNFFSL